MIPSDNNKQNDGQNALRGDPGLQATCPECGWNGNCWIGIATGTASKNAQQEADTHNKNTIHDSGENPAYVISCIGGID